MTRRNKWLTHIPLLQWLRTRLCIKKIGALWCLLMLCSVAINNNLLNTSLGIVQLALLTLLLITAFRFWDDLADIAFDRQHHPERVLVTIDATATRVFYVLSGMLLVLLLLVLWYFFGVSGAIGLLLLIGFIATVYFCLPALTTQRDLRNILVLLKYPAMLVLLSNQPMSLRNGVIVLGLYGLLLAYEYQEEKTQNEIPRSSKI